MSGIVPRFILLAGGEGKRFAPFVTNKTIFPVCGKPLIVHQLEQLARVGVTQVLVATNADNHAVMSQLVIEGLEIQTHQQPEPRGMADAVMALGELLGDQPSVFMNAVDVVSDQLFHDLFTKIATTTPRGVIVGKEMSTYFPGGYLQLEGNRVTGVIEKPAPGSEPSSLVNLVYHYVERPTEFLNHIKNQAAQTQTDDVYERALTAYLQEAVFEYVPYTGFWKKLKYPHFVLDVVDIFLRENITNFVDPTAKISSHAVIEGAVYIAEGAQIQPGAVIQGPAYIGAHAIVGVGSLVRQSCIEARAVVGYGSEVARSYVGPQCMLHHNFIGDSVLEADVNPSYGSVTTNFRFDKGPVSIHMPDGTKLETGRQKLGACLAAGVFSGAHTVFLPGATVGEKARVYPATVVHGFVPAHSVVKSKQQQEVQKYT